MEQITLERTGNRPLSADFLRIEYDPVAYVIGYPPGDQFTLKQERILQSLRLRYESAVSELLSDFPEEL